MKFVIHIPFLLYLQMINTLEIFQINESASLDLEGNNKNPVKMFLSPVFEFGVRPQFQKSQLSLIVVSCPRSTGGTSTGIQKDIHLPN
jgi:hypothetical protein